MYSIYTEDNIQREMTNTGPPKWDLTLTLLFAWIVTYLCICKGIKSSGKVCDSTQHAAYAATMLLSNLDHDLLQLILIQVL